MTNEQEIAFDQDNPEWTEADFARAQPLSAFPDLEAALMRKRGRPAGSVKADTKKSVTLRIDPDVLDGWRATGPGWQARINTALRRALQV
jgi:uncharacterized protein (DUF4415 family)